MTIAPKPAGKIRGFTLIELLVVIAIIGVLVVIVLPGIQGARDAAKVASALGEVRMLEFAFNAYQDEYKKVPRVFPTGTVVSPNIEAVNPFLEMRGNILRLMQGENIQTYNPRRRVFLQINPAKIRNDAYVDPWGNAYRFMLDYNYDGVVMVNSQGVAGELATNLISRRTAVWSRGPEKMGQYLTPIFSW